MFNLDQAITEWRRRMAAGGIKSSLVLDELESHLREDLERLVRAGRGPHEAFEAAVRHIGRSDLLKAEFAKIGEFKGMSFAKMAGMACCILAGLYSTVLARNLIPIPELGFWQRILGLAAFTLTILFLASLRFGYKFLPIIQNRRARKTAVSGFAVAGVVWMMTFANILPNVIVPHFFRGAPVVSANSLKATTPPITMIHHNAPSVESDRSYASFVLKAPPSGGITSIFNIGISLMWSMTLAALLGGVAYGLEEAARRGTKENAYV